MYNYGGGPQMMIKGEATRPGSPTPVLTGSGEMSPRRRSISVQMAAPSPTSLANSTKQVGVNSPKSITRKNTSSADFAPLPSSGSFLPLSSGETDLNGNRSRGKDKTGSKIRNGLFGKKKSSMVDSQEDMPSPCDSPMTSSAEDVPSPLSSSSGEGQSVIPWSSRMPGHFLQALDSSMMTRHSYRQLLDKGIVREWNDTGAAAAPGPPPAIAALSSSGAVPTMLSRRGSSTSRSSAMVMPSVADGGWHVERGSSADFIEGAYNAMEDEDQTCSPYYKIYFSGKEHTNYFGSDPRIGPVLISVATTGATKSNVETIATFRSSARRLLPDMNTHRKKNENARNIVVHRVLIQSKHGSKQIFVRSTPDMDSLFKGLALACGPMGYLPEIQDIKFKKVTIDITSDLLKLEQSHFSYSYKFGVLYYKRGQGENEMFSNSTSPEMERFLNFLGDRVTLKGWTNFTGGLDVKNDSTGTQSVYTQFRDLSVMFHVCTLLPFYPKDPQQLERKRHIGNDIVVIVYVEPGATFDPCMMKTQFNHIYAVVSVDPNDQSVKLEFAVKQGVRPFGPKLVPGQRFTLDNSFREFFFSKLINSERAALKATVFAQKIEHTRKKMIESIIERIPTPKTK